MCVNPIIKKISYLKLAADNLGKLVKNDSDELFNSLL